MKFQKKFIGLLIVCGLLVSSVFASEVSSSDVKSLNKLKLSSNFLTMVLAGDLNFNLEKPVSDYTSLVLGFHKPDNSETTFGGYTGYRFYSEKDQSGQLIQFTAGYNNQVNANVLSLEGWLMTACNLGVDKGVFYEYGFGIGRQFKFNGEDSSPYFMYGLNIGFRI